MFTNENNGFHIYTSGTKCKYGYDTAIIADARTSSNRDCPDELLGECGNLTYDNLANTYSAALQWCAWSASRRRC